MVFILVLLVLTVHAQTHAELLAVTGQFYHSDLSALSANAGGPCEWVGENLFRGSNPDDRWVLYAASPGHAANVVHPRDYHAVGHAVSGDTHYVVDVFCEVPKKPPAATRAPPTTTTTIPLSPRLIVVSPPLCSVQPREICVD